MGKVKFKILFGCLLLFCLLGCSERLVSDSNQDGREISVQKGNESLDISEKDAVFVAKTFLHQETKSLNKEVEEIVVLKDSLQEPLAYIINYVSDGGFVIVSATKEFYPVLAFSESGRYEVKSNMFSDVWLEVMEKEIAYRKSNIDTTYFTQWDKYVPPITSSNSKETKGVIESYQNIDWWRSELIGELYNTNNYPQDYFAGRGEFVGDVYCTLNEARQYFDDYSGEFDRVESSLINNGYDPNVAIVHIKTFYEHTKKDKMLTTLWHQHPPFTKHCPDQKAPGCVPVAIGQIMNYHKWPTDYADWGTNGLSDEQGAELLARIGGDIGMHYGEDETYPKFWKPLNFGDLSQVKEYFTHKKYSVSKDSPKGNLGEISRSILDGYPVYMEGTQESFSFFGISFPSLDAHAWVCDGFIMSKYTNVMVDLYIPQNYNPGNYVPLERNPYRRDLDFLIYKEREYGWSYYHMNWGWGYGRWNNNDGSTSVSNGWFLNADISVAEDVNFSTLYRFIKVTPNR